MGRVLLALISTLFLVTQVMAGTWTSNNFLYKPATGARGDDEKAKFDLGLNRVDSRLANEKWLNDSPYSGNLGTAITAIGSAQTVLSLPAGNWSITADLTVPANLTLKFAHGALLTIATGKTLTINGPLEAGLYQIFSCTGTGKVLFAQGSVPYVCPEWWYSGSGSWHPALNAAYKAFYGVYTADTGAAVTDWGYVSILLSKMYTVTNSPWLMDDLRSGQIIGVGRGISGIYQSGTGDAISMQLGDGPLDAQNPHLTLGHFSVIGNATSGCGISTNSCCLIFYDMDLLRNGSHGFYASSNGWQTTFRDVFSNENGGDGFRWINVGDNLQFIGGGANKNNGKGINVNVNSLTKAALISTANVNYNGNSGIFISYGQYRIDSCYFESNTGKQLETWDILGGFITNNNFYDATSVATHAIYLNSDTTVFATKNITINGNMFAGNTINIWQGGYASGCVLGPNHVIDGTDEIYGKNILISSIGAITAPALAFAKQVVAFNASYNVNLALGGYIVTSDIANASAVTVNPPTNPTTGQEVIFDWTKTTNSLTINWNAAFKTSYTSMAASKRVIVRFLYDGTHYIQVGTPVELTP